MGKIKSIGKKIYKAADFGSRVATQTMTGVNLMKPNESKRMRAVGKDIESRLPASKQFLAITKLPQAKRDESASAKTAERLKQAIETLNKKPGKNPHNTSPATIAPKEMLAQAMKKMKK